MDKQNQKFIDFIERTGRILEPRVVTIKNYKLADVVVVFMLANKSILHFYLFMSQNEDGKEILYDMFGRASKTQLDEAHRLLVFWFLWQRDWARDLSFLKSTKIHDGLIKIWSFSESEINNLKQELDSESEKKLGGETTLFWKKLQNILGNDSWMPLFAFPALNISLKMCWKELDLSIGDNI